MPDARRMDRSDPGREPRVSAQPRPLGPCGSPAIDARARVMARREGRHCGRGRRSSPAHVRCRAALRPSRPRLRRRGRVGMAEPVRELMSTATRGREDQVASSKELGRDRVVHIAAAIAGPALIVVAVLVVYRAYVFHDVLSSRHIDMLAYYLPNDCFLGATLRAGHIPLWNPYTLSGTPFAADPLSGWMSLPTMLTFAALPCGQAMRLFIVVQPLIAGLGMYWFLRGESLSRIASTSAGLILALPIAGSQIGIALAFAGVVAWLPVMLGAESRCLRAGAWPIRLGWCIVTALAWGQVVASHLPVGIMVGTIAVVVYGTARILVEVRAGRLSWRGSLVLGGVIMVSVPA